MTESLRGAAGAQVEAQAKVNLRLRILAREVGGHHQLETLFLRIGLADTVRVRRTAGARSLDVTGLPAGASLGDVAHNLAWRAADAYLAAARWTGGFAIELEKRIPVGGGLGGGSADAGGVLRLLDAIAPAPLGESALSHLAAALGADVPFLASEQVYVLAWGRGERMLALSPPPRRPLLLVVPSFAVNTAEAYRWLVADREADPSSGEGARDPLLHGATLSDWGRLSELAVNDFEPVVGRRHPGIAAIVAGLRAAGAEPALMSGSGSVVLGVLPAAAGVERGIGVGGRVIATTTATSVEPVRPLD